MAFHRIPNEAFNNKCVLESGHEQRFAGPISNQLHLRPVALKVTANGERQICPIDDVNTNLSSFVYDQKESGCWSTSEEPISKRIKKIKKSHIQKRRKIQERGLRKMAKVISAQQPKQQIVQKNASIQTDMRLTISRPVEYIGDTKIPNCNSLVRASSPKEEQQHHLSLTNKKLTKKDIFLNKCVPDNLQKLISFLIMIILIFWLSSAIVDCNVPLDFWRIFTSYLRSFKWNNYYKEPQTNVEKYFEYLTNFLTQLFN